MDSVVKYIEPYLQKYNREFIDSRICSGSMVYRRGCCGLINVTTFIPKIISDLALEKKDILSPYIEGQLYDIYYSPSNKFYIKRLCICDKGCLTKCGKNKNKENCDGHHVIIVSLNDSLDINEGEDYVIDFTYKQMIHSGSEEMANMEIARKMPDYLLVPYMNYVNYSDTARWKENISEPCKNIVNNSNVVESKFKVKYLKYKSKYMALKKLMEKN